MFIVTYTAQIVDTNTSLRDYRSSFLRVIFQTFLWFHLMSAQCPFLKIGFYVSRSDNNRRKHFKTFHQNKLDFKEINLTRSAYKNGQSILSIKTYISGINVATWKNLDDKAKEFSAIVWTPSHDHRDARKAEPSKLFFIKKQEMKPVNDGSTKFVGCFRPLMRYFILNTSLQY